FCVPALALFSLIFVGSESKTITIVILVVGVGFNAGQLSGFNLNHIDLSPVHAGTLVAITNSAATVAAILAPLSVDLFQTISGYDENDKRLWNIVFAVAGGIFLVTAIFFDILGSGEVQPWNNPRGGNVETKPMNETQLRMLRKISTTLSM
ncbi:putative inorganic phosphate cotransporter, partial [Gonioctena quinquepunctata]